MSNWKARYDAHKADVDTIMGRQLGWWGRRKAKKDPNNLTAQRKAAILKAEAASRLYQPQNIIGTTSAIGQQPTVYYRTMSGTFGHITQEHKIPENVGREAPGKHPLYTAANTGKGGALEEKIGNRVIHTSRNQFKAFDPMASNAHEILTAHTRNPGLKQVSNPDVHKKVVERLKKGYYG